MAADADTMSWLYSLESRGEVYRLERMEHALGLIGNPHRRLQAVHIAGTKGKGSVAAMLDAMLRAAGYRTGLYTKPHLVRLTERTRISGAEMPAELLLDYVTRLRPIFDRAGLALTFFEFTVALMFLYFADSAVDAAVIETGLGGRLDSTNVVRPMLSVITSIGFDHMDRLGNTLAEIAREKGGIIKRDVPAVVGARAPEARQVLCGMAHQLNSPTQLIDRDFGYVSRAPAHRIDYQGCDLHLRDVEVNLAGPCQHENAAIALAAAEALRAAGWRLEEHAIRRGLADVVWPGRFEVVSRDPLVIFDCAHNELSIAALLETMRLELGEAVRPRLLFACLADKQWREMAGLLAPHVSSVVLTTVRPKRSLEPEYLVPLFAPHVPAKVVRDPLQAIENVMGEARTDEVILVAGSVYLIGDVYPWFLERQGRRALFPEAAL